MDDSLFKKVVEGTGLPQGAISRELELLLESAGISKESLTLEELRVLLSDYLQDIALELIGDGVKS